MVHYKKKLRRRPDGSFTPEEDELLLRYIAAMGPQFIWGITEIADLATRLFPTTHIRRIYERTHCSQWHPLSKDSIWTKEEEQKLVLAMKVYSDVSGESGGDGTLSATNKDVTNDEDDDDDDGAGGERSSDEHQVEEEQSARTALEKKAIRKAATHFHPQRQLYKVVKKMGTIVQSTIFIQAFLQGGGSPIARDCQVIRRKHSLFRNRKTTFPESVKRSIVSTVDQNRTRQRCG